MQVNKELLSNAIDLVVGIVLLILYFLEVTLIVDYLWHIVLVLLGCRFLIDSYFMARRLQQKKEQTQAPPKTEKEQKSE